MGEQFVRLTHYIGEDEENDFAKIEISDGINLIKIYETRGSKETDELDKVLSVLSKHNVISLNIKHKSR